MVAPKQKHLDYKQAEKAIKAIKEYTDKENEDSLLSNQQGLWVNIKLAKMTDVQPDRQISIPVPHCTLADDAEVCFIPIDQPKVYEEKVKEMKLPRNVTVLSGKQFREKYGRFEAKRLACQQYAHFLLDAALATKLHNMFGKTFQKANRSPVLVKVVEAKNKMIDATELEKNIKQGINTVVYDQTPSDLKACRFGHTDMSIKELVANLKAVMAQLEKDIAWDYVQNVSIRVESGDSLPVYCCVPGTWLLKDAESSTEKIVKKAAKAVQEKKETKKPAAKAAKSVAKKADVKPAAKPTTRAAATKQTKNVKTPKQITKKKVTKK
ncbi:ribosomal protein L1 [Hesseltinella vesiculosa]|uniref:Ribosomal protein L1 n=1 Tax=Hesseltinella vesiculosa TaxID=101127 RepID=A0A1X2GL76_9FUNG|nr:ribosomal protein L1 [Hesseltinella vesiculosa]